MYIQDFDYYRPATLKEASKLLAKYGDQAKVLAGGTDLLPKMKNGMLATTILVSLKSISNLSEIEYLQGKGVVIGAKATHNDLVNSSLLQERYPSISEAAHVLANNQVRNMGTVGGNIVNATPSADLPPILIALDAQLTLFGINGQRTVPLENFLIGPNQCAIKKDEILTHIVIPDQPSTGSSYLKFGLRRSGALAIVGVAANVVARGATIEKARIVLSAVAPTTMRAKGAEQLLTGKTVTEPLLEEVGRTAALECRPISDLRSSAEYRRDLVRVFTKRVLRKVLKLEDVQEEGVRDHGPY